MTNQQQDSRTDSKTDLVKSPSSSSKTTLQGFQNHFKFFWSFFHFPIIVGVCLIFLLALVGIWNGNYNKFVDSTTAIHGYHQWDLKNTDSLDSFLNYGGLVRDSGHYTFIAKNGSYLVADNSKFLDNFAFFPLYPMEIRFIHTITFLDYPQSVLLTGFINTLLFCCLLYLFLNKYIVSKDTLDKVFLLSCLLPFNYFFFVSYSESLFGSLLLLILLILRLCNFSNPVNKFHISLYLLPLLTFLISLTRSPGVIISVMIGLLLIQSGYKNFLLLFSKQNLRVTMLLLFSIFTNISGLVSFLLYGFIQTGNFWISRDVQANWDRGSTKNILEPIFNFISDTVLRCLTDYCYATNYINPVYWGFSLVLIILSLVVSIKYFRKTPLFIPIFFSSILFCALPLTTNTLMSLHRLFIISPIYFLFLPIFITHYIPKKYYHIILCLFVMFFFITASYYYKIETVG